MMRVIFFLAVVAIVLLSSRTGMAGNLVLPHELELKKAWTTEHLLEAAGDKSSALPFEFACGGKPSAALLADWTRTCEDKRLDETRVQHTSTWRDPETGIEVQCVAVEYLDFPVVEWTVYLRNTGSTDTPIIEDIEAVSVLFERGGGGEFLLRGIKGDSNTPDSYQPWEKTLEPGTSTRFAPEGGRPTNGAFPCYSLQMHGGGITLAIGWPGQWAAEFVRDAAKGLHIRAGQERTHLYLKPGEVVRTPLAVLMFWDGTDPLRTQNLWRRWFLAHNVPQGAGNIPRRSAAPPSEGGPESTNETLNPMLSFCSGGFFEGLKVSEASEKLFIDTLTAQGIHLDYWWMDAGWYPCDSWPQTGTWTPDPARFPNGLRAVSDYVHARDTKLIVWFEPERVTAGSWIAENHPEWLLGGTLLNLGNPDARQWLTDHVDGLITGQGIDLYRQDFNMDPLDYWRKNDAADREGMTENLHVQGYLAYWDELQRRHPGMLIDSCASGGRRNDLETLRRAVPLLRSDYQAFDGNPAFAPGNQGHTYGLSSWIPYYGQGVYYTSEGFVYNVRSYLSPAFAICADVRKPGIDWDLYRRMIAQWREAAPCMLGDYYPLTPYDLGDGAWMAWQFDRPETGDGVVQAFRHPKAENAAETYRLHGLDEGKAYVVMDLDTGTTTKYSGKALMEEGVRIGIPDAPGGALLTYRRAEGN